jgi:hypothetical protein
VSDEILRIAPNSRPEAEFFSADEYEVLFGGAAGGGKTWSLVVDPMRYIHLSNFTGIIWRRTFPELEGSVLPMTYKYYQAAGGTYNVQRKTWTFPAPGTSIRLGTMEHPEDWRNYQGHPYCYQGFDELTNFLDVQYESMAAWSRTECSVPPYRRSSSNPGGVGMAWVNGRFVKTCPSVPFGPRRYSKLGRMWWQPMQAGPTFTWEDPDTKLKLTRKFIPSRVFDNIDNLRRNPNYLAQLLQLRPARRKALLNGDWTAFEGQFFDEWVDDMHKIPSQNPPPGANILGAIDYGDVAVLEVQFTDYEGNVVNFAECHTEHMQPWKRFNAMADMLIERQLFNINIICDTDMYVDLSYTQDFKKTPIAMAESVFEQRMGHRKPNLLQVYKYSPDKPSYRIACNEAMHQYLGWEVADDPTNDAAYRMGGGNSRYVRGGQYIGPKFFVTVDCPRLIESITSLATDPSSKDGGDYIQKGARDHDYSAAKYALMSSISPLVPEGQKGWQQQMAEQATAAVEYQVGDP